MELGRRGRLSSLSSIGFPRPTAQSEAAVMINASGTISDAELPNSVQTLPHLVIQPSGSHIPGPTTFASKATLSEFASTFREFLASLERHKNLRHLHLFIAAPLSAAITIGRAWPHDNAAPTFTVYHRTDNSYQEALTFPIS